MDHSQDCEVAMNMLQARVDTEFTSHPKSPKPWDVYWYLVGTNHKAGTVLLRSMTGRMFLVLGATYSCQVQLPGEWGLITTDGLHSCSNSDAHIRFDKDLCPQSLQKLRQISGGAMRAVTMIRDPAVILASAYCYHHRGQEYGLQPAPGREPWPWPGIMSMGPAEGMATLSDGMFGVLDCMTESVEIAGNDTLVVRYEDVTRSSQDFDRTARQMVDFLFGGLISNEDRGQMLVEVQKEDLHRGIDWESAQHTNAAGCEQEALEVLPSLTAVHAHIKDRRNAQKHALVADVEVCLLNVGRKIC